jgi:pyrroloquinoline quinone biosynthesis protein D
MDNTQTNQRAQQFLTPTVRPTLAPKARVQIDKVSGESVLLYPEGVVMLNETGAAIVRLCDGQHTFTEIVAELAQHYQIGPDLLQDDVGEYIKRLYRHSLMELRGLDAASTSPAS